MHELSLCQAILEHVEARAGDSAVPPVKVPGAPYWFVTYAFPAPAGIM